MPRAWAHGRAWCRLSITCHLSFVFAAAARRVGLPSPYYTQLESVKFAWEGYHYYKNWADHIGVEGEPIASLTECGSLVLVSPLSEPFLDQALPHLQALGACMPA